MLSQDLLKNPQVQRILCDLGARLEGFMFQHAKQNPSQFKDFVLKGTISSFLDKPSPSSGQKKISYKFGTTTPTPVLADTRNVFTPDARHRSVSGNRSNLKSAANPTRPSPQKR